MSALASRHVLHRTDLNVQVCNLLRDRIVAGTLAPQQRLTIHGLAAELGVSRTSTALTRLVEEGLISLRPRRGYYVTALTQKQVNDAYGVRLSLEIMAAEETVARLDDDQIRRLRTLAHAARSLPRRRADIRRWHGANQALHEYQVDLAGNPTASAIFRRLSVNLMMEGALALEVDTEPSLVEVGGEHDEIVSAYEAGDVARAISALRNHNATCRRIAADTLARSGGTA